ncbi:MAG: MoaD/ThiS family protein [Gemmatimonadota bacterium]|nr:MoaD/ThiS family protein [Gemmatimonadota bacterium]
MRVRTLFFGVYAELAATREGSTELPPGSTVADLVVALRRGSLDWLPDRVVVAVNQSYAEPGTALADGDEVALIPPVAGG